MSMVSVKFLTTCALREKSILNKLGAKSCGKYKNKLNSKTKNTNAVFIGTAFVLQKLRYFLDSQVIK